MQAEVDGEMVSLLKLHDLRHQQELLEKELSAVHPTPETLQMPEPVDANTFQSQTGDFHNTRAISPVERLDEIRRRHRREAHRTMQRYFSALNNFRDYQERRMEKLRNVQPFSFEARELRRPRGIHARRMEEDRLKREQEEQRELNRRFKSNPVPPSTYMNKYDLMVEEWRQRRVMVEALAAEKAERIREEKEFMQLCVSGLRNVREVMGARRQRRSESDYSRGHNARDCRQVSEIRDVPVEVALKLWPAIEEHEQIRVERIKQRAVHQMEEVKAEESQRVAAAEQTGRTQPWFGMTPVEFLQLHQRQQQQQVQQQGDRAANIVPVSGPVVTVSSQHTATAPPPSSAVPSSSPPTGVLVMAPLSKPEVSGGVSESKEDKTPKRRSRSTSAKRNPNLTFKPKIRGGVPNFEALWAEERLALAERKLKRQPTQVEPFKLTVSGKEEVIRGRPLHRKKQQRPGSATRPARRKRSVPKPPEGKEGSSGGTGETEDKRGLSVPKGTRAHAMRTQAVFERYITAAEAKQYQDKRSEETAALKEAYQRQKRVNARLKEYLKSTQVNTDDVIRKKVTELRRLGREAEREAAEQLNEMLSRVVQIPPIFVEPVHLHSAAKVRAETEKEILRLLKESGVDGGTLSAIIQGCADASDDDNAAGADNAATAAAAAGEASKKSEPDGEARDNDEKDEPSKSGSDGEVDSGEKGSRRQSTEGSSSESESHEGTKEGKDSESKETSEGKSDSESKGKSGTEKEDSDREHDDKDSEYGTDFESTSSKSAVSV